MFIAIVGTPSAGKHSVLEYLVTKHGFTQIHLAAPKDSISTLSPLSGLTISSSSSSSLSSTPAVTPSVLAEAPPEFTSPAALLDFITRNWLARLVTIDLRTYSDIEIFIKRPSFLLLAVDGPLRSRFEREVARQTPGRSNEEGSVKIDSSILTLDKFIDQHDQLLNGTPDTLKTISPLLSLGSQPKTDFKRILDQAQLIICNNFPTLSLLHAHLDALDLLNPERLRPGWDTYFMTLASLASHRSNCMKRRVGAVLVRSKRILSTGYNGTPRGTRNCNEGGCSRCNASAKGGEALNECYCLHAEENALLEAGRDRIGDDSVLYCNTCPCLRCSVKIVQCGVREVVYNQSYSMDEASAMVLKEGGVLLRQLHMP